MERARITEIAALSREKLLDDVLAFWIRHGYDTIYGGFLTGLDRKGKMIESDKSVWFQGRGAWTFAQAYMLKADPLFLEAALSAIRFSDAHCYDAADQRMYFRVCRDGARLIKRRYIFSECFAAMAKAAAAVLTTDPKLLAQARVLLDRIQDYRNNPLPENAKMNAYIRPMAGLSLPMMEINVAQEIREADDRLEGSHVLFCTELIQKRIDEIQHAFVKEDLGCVLEQSGPDGQYLKDHFEGRLVNPGHSIELAWFILRESDYLRTRDETRAEHYQTLGVTIVDWMLKKSWDEEYGGFLYFLDAEGLPPYEYWHDMKFWWPHNEAIIACLYTYVLTRDEKYAAWFEKIWDWSHQHFMDTEYGEWFGYLNRDGSVSTTLKGNMFKGPFHLPRMYICLLRLCQRLLTC